MKRIIAIILAAIMVFSIAACAAKQTSDEPQTDAVQNDAQASTEAENTADDTAESTEPVTINLWSQFSDPNSTDGNYIAFYEALDALKTAMPEVNVVHEGTEQEAYKVKMKTSMAANELPDVFFNWGSATIKPYVDAELVLPLNDYLDDATMSRLLGGTTDNFTFDGKIYGLPYSVAVASLYANTALFEQYGLTIPTNYEELVTAVETFKENGITPIALGENTLWPGLMIYGIMAIRMAGTEYFNQAMSGTATFQTEELIQAAQYLQNLSEMGAFGDSVMSTSQDDAVAMIKQGKAAMMFMGSWLNGDCEADDSLVKGQVDVIKFPLLDGGSDNINEFHGGCGEGFFVSASTEHPKEAAAVVAFITEYMSKVQYAAGSGMPAWSADLSDVSDLNRLSVEIAELTADATGYVYWLDTISEGSAADSLKNEIAELIALQQTPEQFCADLDAIYLK